MFGVLINERMSKNFFDVSSTSDFFVISAFPLLESLHYSTARGYEGKDELNCV